MVWVISFYLVAGFMFGVSGVTGASSTGNLLLAWFGLFLFIWSQDSCLVLGEGTIMLGEPLGTVRNRDFPTWSLLDLLRCVIGVARMLPARFSLEPIFTFSMEFFRLMFGAIFVCSAVKFRLSVGMWGLSSSKN